jgi:uncharacterized membrane protein
MANICPECGKGELLLKQTRPSVSAAGLFGALLAVIGFVVALFNPVVGILLIIVGILIGVFGRGKHTEAICPMCGYRKSL